ncbi:DEAD/DEAH box helicase [Candidatus Nanohaloarchaea archaeon]|nr:DEAD/DEAH box helicase [Candidatus Nanohaloarchaea archaeon]
MDLFPFEQVRDRQDELVEASEQALEDESNLVAHAPTGLGKTAATVTPAIEKAREQDKKVFFLTPRHSQHQIALETVRKMNERHGENIISVDLIGKDHLCEADISTRGGEGPDCPRHDNTFKDNHELTTQAQRKLKEVKHQNLSAGEMKQACDKVCAYSLSMQLAADADLVIADYFHIFHPGVREAVLENADINLEDCILIVDEAHNMPSRTRSLFTYSLSMPNIKRAITEAETFGYYSEQENLDQLKRVVSRMANEKLSQTEQDSTMKKDDLVDSIDNFHDYEDMVKDMENVAEEVEEEQERSYCAQIAEFLRAWEEGEDNGFVRVIKREYSQGSQTLKIKYSCLDPQISSKKPLNKAHSSILMSATLTPQEMYVQLLGLEEDKTETRAFKSPFPEENELDLVIPTLTTKYEERGDSMWQKYAWYLSKSFEAVDGNCGVFFPSYAMMNKVKPLIEEHSDRKIFIEERKADKDEKQDLLDKFADRKEAGDSVLLGVAAGSFGEGVDFPGEVLKAVFIVGLPLQRPDLETKELIDFYDEKFGKGWDYGYSYPAMNRAIQAAGRCIRSSTDEGVIVYMDERYEWSNYRKVFPDDKKLVSTRAPWKEINEFFSKNRN